MIRLLRVKKTLISLFILITFFALFYWNFKPIRQAFMRTEIGSTLLLAARKELYLDFHHVISSINLNGYWGGFIPVIFTPKNKQGIPIVLDAYDEIVCKSIRMRGAWERRLTHRVLELIKPSDVIVEVGANFGYYTLLMGKSLDSRGKLYTYEANPDVYKALRKSILLNDLGEKITAKNIAVADKDFESFLTFTQQNVGGGHVILSTQNAELNECQKTSTCRKISATSLDKDLQHLPKIDFLRMDAEGSEIMIFKGAKELIKRSPQLTIVMEWSPAQMSRYADVKELLDYLEAEGFMFWEVNDDGIVTGKRSEELLTLETNIILSRTPLNLTVPLQR